MEEKRRRMKGKNMKRKKSWELGKSKKRKEEKWKREKKEDKEQGN